MSKQEGINAISKAMTALPAQLSDTILKHIHSLTDYEPVIGIMGKTGAGKSSLCNALFAGEVSPVSDVAAGTREPLRFRLQAGERFMTIVDLPGVGESESRDAEYAAMYRQQLPHLDLVLWLVKADDRALAVDEHFYCQIIGEDHRHKVMFVISQSDKIEPVSGNTKSLSIPQLRSIRRKTEILSTLFTPVHPVCAVSVRMQYGITLMAERMIRCLPREASSPVSARLQQPLRTTRVKETARTDFSEAVGDVLDSIAAMPFVPQIARTVLRYVRNAVVSVAHVVWDFFF
ncbi:GTPase family protein [Pantoea sp. SS70]|uniref:GTPase family protein n=1 Tax=Pantoea sp. SS70 TaxID=3024247 RepID=UPI002452D529|nr:GTPase family protein [Pantoea sp. SS70]WGK56699.1 GTPase family protein [Pantoea sp. SS70]